MDQMTYLNDLLARHEELFYHELSDCAGWKTEFIGVDYIQSKDINGKTPVEIIEGCAKAITADGLAKSVAYAIAGNDILLCLDVAGCAHLPKEITLTKRGIKPYNCLIANMINDRLIEVLGFETAYVAHIHVDGGTSRCRIQVAIYENPAKIGAVSDWAEEIRRLDATNGWKKVAA